MRFFFINVCNVAEKNVDGMLSFWIQTLKKQQSLFPQLQLIYPAKIPYFLHYIELDNLIFHQGRQFTA